MGIEERNQPAFVRWLQRPDNIGLFAEQNRARLE
jgi:hypothetical protein